MDVATFEISKHNRARRLNAARYVCGRTTDVARFEICKRSRAKRSIGGKTTDVAILGIRIQSRAMESAVTWSAGEIGILE